MRVFLMEQTFYDHLLTIFGTGTCFRSDGIADVKYTTREKDIC